jgi:hypothetical protein
MTSIRTGRARELVGLAGLALLAGCGGGGGAEGGAPPEPPSPPPAPIVQPTAGFAAPASAREVTIDGASVAVATGQVIVVLVEDVSVSARETVIERMRTLGATAIGERRELRMLVATVPDGTEGAAIDALRGLAGVAHAGWNFVIESARPNPPRAPGWMPSWLPREAKQAIATAGRWWATQIDLAGAQAVEDQLGITGGVTAPRIAIVDTGLAAGQSVIDEARVARVDALGAALSDDTTADAQTHGRDVLAFAAGSSADAAGVARHARVLSVDVYRDECTGILAFLGCPLDIGRTFHTDLAEGVRTAVLSDARVINVSWESKVACSDPQSVRNAAQQGFRAVQSAAVNLARRNDKLVVFAAGNKCEKADDQLLPSADDPQADSWRSHALIVGGSTEAKQDALFSRMGGVVNLMAPGEQISWGASKIDGTSFAAPIVAGGAALLQGISPELSAAETRYLLLDSADPVITFAAASTAGFRGYVGPDATGPSRLLNLGAAASGARLTRGAPLQTVEATTLAKGQAKTVEFDVAIPETGVRALDVVFVIDVSGSYGDDIATLRTQAGAIVDALLARGIDVQFGVTAYSDFPVAPYGGVSDVGFQRLSRLGADRAATLAAIDALVLRFGSDEPESQLEALYQVATGAGRDLDGNGVIDAARGDIAAQPVGWRPGAARVVLFATDASFHDRDRNPAYPGAGFSATVAALNAGGIRVIGLQSGGSVGAESDIARLVAATGGSAYQLSSNSAEIAGAIAAGIDDALAELEVSIEKVAGVEWMAAVRQDKVRVRPGETLRVSVDLVGQRAESIDRLRYDLYLWVRANGQALVQRVKLPVEVAP